MTGGNTDCHSKEVKTAHFIFDISNQVFPHLHVDNTYELIPLMGLFVNFQSLRTDFLCI